MKRAHCLSNTSITNTSITIPKSNFSIAIIRINSSLAINKPYICLTSITIPLNVKKFYSIGDIHFAKEPMIADDPFQNQNENFIQIPVAVPIPAGRDKSRYGSEHKSEKVKAESWKWSIPKRLEMQRAMVNYSEIQFKESRKRIIDWRKDAETETESESVNNYNEIHAAMIKTFQSMGWQADSQLNYYISHGRIEDAVRIVIHGEATHYDGFWDTHTIAACLEGLLAKKDIDMGAFHDLNQSHHLSIFDQFLEFMDYTNSRNRMKMYHVIAAFRMVGLDHEWGKVFDSWRESNGNNEDLLKSLDDGENRKEYMLTCNALADCFAEKGDLATVIFITKCVFLLGIQHQSKELFQLQIKASGRSLENYSPVMSIKQMENKGYPIDGETMAIFMRSMHDSARYHAVYAIYKQLQSFTSAQRDDSIVNCEAMYECMLDTLIKESILTLIDPHAKFMETNGYFYEKQLDLILKQYQTQQRNLIKIGNRTFSKSPFNKYACTMYKYILKEMVRNQIKSTPRIIMLQLLYGLLHSYPSIYYQIALMITQEKVSWARKDHQEWKTIDLIFQKWSRIL